MTVRITYRDPPVGDDVPETGTLQQRRFDTLGIATAWILMNIAPVDRVRIRLCVDQVEMPGKDLLAMPNALR